MPYEHHFIDDDPGFDGWGAVVIADFDGDGRPEFATGGKGGGIYCLFDFRPEDESWERQVITSDFSPNVGAAVVDRQEGEGPGLSAVSGASDSCCSPRQLMAGLQRSWAMAWTIPTMF